MSKRKLLERRVRARSRAAAALAVVGALVMSTGVFMLAAPAATAAGNDDKWFVCKWVSKPKIGEAAHHVIGVDDGPVGGGWFNDGQWSSYALEEANGQDEPDVSKCPRYDPPGDEEIDPPAGPDPVDPCGLDNIAFPVMVAGDGYDWTLLGNGDLTVQPQPGYVFTGSSQLVTFELPADSGVLCDVPQRSPDVSAQSEQQFSCANGVEARSRTVTTSYSWNRQTKQFDSSVSYSSWSSWIFVRGLTDTEFEQLGCRPDQPEPAEVVGSETRVSCAGLEKRGSSQVTTFVWNDATREYDAVVGDVEWSGWVKVRNLTAKELRAEGCVLGEETLVPTPKPDQEPTVKGVERVAPPAAVPTAVAAGVGEALTSPRQQRAQLMVGAGLVLLLVGAWVGLGRPESGAHEG